MLTRLIKLSKSPQCNKVRFIILNYKLLEDVKEEIL